MERAVMPIAGTWLSKLIPERKITEPSLHHFSHVLAISSKGLAAGL